MADETNQRAAWWPWVILGLLAFAVAWVPLPLPAPAPAERTIRIEAGDFAYSPGVISVNRGDQVTLELVSTDVVHGIYIDGYELELVADPGKTARLSFVADRTGSFRFRCAVTCGALHPFMIGKLKVGPNPMPWRLIALSILAILAGGMLYRQNLGHPDLTTPRR